MKKDELRIGWASRDVTPDKPVGLLGQNYMRISQAVNDPLTVTALALESAQGEQAVMVSCDLCFTTQELIEKCRQRVQPALPDLDMNKLFLGGTHTHTAPFWYEGDRTCPPSRPDLMNPLEYEELFVARTADCIIEAWKSRRPGGISWGLGQAVVGHNRRIAYFDGTAQMYGKTDVPNFSHVEGDADHRVDMLFTWDADQRLTGMVINVACPSQVSEHEKYVSADFWHEIRAALRTRFSPDLFVLAQCGPGGDQSPHPLILTKAETRMQQLKGITAREEIADRVVRAVERVLPAVRQEIHANPAFTHRVKTIELPVDERSSYQKKQPVFPMELHVIRLGDVAFATNSFELFLDFGIRIKARSKALQTFLIQLVGGTSYLPTARAVAGGGYGATGLFIGPAGGQVLVEETVEAINRLYADQTE